MSAESHYYWQCIPAYLLFAYLFFLVGLFIGWILWRHSRKHAEEIEHGNHMLREEYRSLKNQIESLAAKRSH